MTDDELIEKLLLTPVFRRAGMRGDLLKYLADHRDQFTTDEEIWTQVYKKNADIFSEQSVRERCSDLRGALANCFPPMRKGRFCELPEATVTKGYKLEFGDRGDTPTEVFWRPHIQLRRDILFVSNQPLFFGDSKANRIFRYFDINPSNEKPLDDLKARPNTDFDPAFEPVYPYLPIGEVGARDAICTWFSKKMGLLLNRVFSNRIHDDTIMDKSLILLGESSNNRFIEWLEFGGLEAKAMQEIRWFGWYDREDYLAYRLIGRSKASPFGRIEIYQPTEEEKQHFPGGVEGVRSVGDKVTVYTLENNPRSVVYGVVRRLPHPYNGAAVTIISSSYSDAIEQIAIALTEDEQFSKISHGLPLEEGKLPSFFEGIFAVQLRTTHLSSGPLKPQHVAWRIPPVD